MKTIRIGVPPGVGDVYWVLTKLQAFRAWQRADRVTLCVQRSRLPRALEWARMVDFVDAAEEYAFKPDQQALADGLSIRPRLSPREQRLASSAEPLDFVLWPNAVLDRGAHLSSWLPTLDLDLSFPVKTAPGPRGRVVVYASSSAINQAWVRLEPEYWAELIAEIAELTGAVPTLIGAPWDVEFRNQIICEVDDLLGKTTLPEVAGIIERASVVVGVICGMTILANHFRTPTVALMPDKFHPAFPTSWVAPDAPYEAIAAARIPTAAELARRVAAIARKVV